MTGFDRLDQDEPALVGKDQEMKVLKEMNELEDSVAKVEDL